MTNAPGDVSDRIGELHQRLAVIEQWIRDNFPKKPEEETPAEAEVETHEETETEDEEETKPRGRGRR